MLFFISLATIPSCTRKRVRACGGEWRVDQLVGWLCWRALIPQFLRRESLYGRPPPSLRTSSFSPRWDRGAENGGKKKADRSHKHLALLFSSSFWLSPPSPSLHILRRFRVLRSPPRLASPLALLRIWALAPLRLPTLHEKTFTLFRS